MTSKKTFLLSLFIICLTAYKLSAQDTKKSFIPEAEKLADRQEFEKSTETYRAGLKVYEESKDWPNYYQARYGITYNLIDLYKFDEAKDEIEDAISHFENNYKDTFLLIQPRLYHAAGQVYLDLHQYDKAIANNRKAMKYYQNVKDKKERAKFTSFMYNNIGTAYKQRRSMDSALYYYELALPLKIEALGQNANSTLRTIKAISGIYQDWGQLDKAIETQTIALEGAIKEGNKDAEAQAYNGLSQMYQRKKDFETSRNYISKAMEIYKGLQPEFKMDLAHSYHQMGNVLETEKAHQESLEWYLTAKKMYREIHNGKYSYQEGNSTMNLGKAHNYMAAQLEASSPEYDADHPEVRALREKGLEYFEENEEIFTASVSKDHARWIELWLSKGVCHLENRDSVAAHELFSMAYDRAYKLAPEKSYDRSLSCLNLARTTKDPEEAIQLYQQGLWELSRGWEPQSPGDNPSADEVFYENWSVTIMINKAAELQKLAKAQEDENHLDAALKTINAADELLAESRSSFLTTSAKVFLGRMGHDVYSKGAEVGYEKGGQEAQVFEYIEKDKGLVLLEALHSGRRIQDVMVPDSLANKLQRTAAKIAELTAEQNQFREDDRYAILGGQIFDLEQERKRIETKIKELYPLTARISEDGRTLTLSDVQRKLGENEVIYEYLMAEEALFILKIQKDVAKLYRKERTEFSSQLDSLLSLISDEDIAINRSNSPDVFLRYGRLAHRLFRTLLPDYKNENLLVIPDGNLNYLPFELLLTEPVKGDQINYSLLPYLLKLGNVKYAFSSSLHFAEVEHEDQGQGRMLAIAPTYPASPRGFLASRAGFSSLEHTASEAELVSRLMSGKILVGNAATVEEFKKEAEDYQVLHLAMHAYTHDQDPMLSGMVFTETNEDEDHILHAHELYNMNIPSDLVVLSACNTGLGQYSKGEGVMSLGRAFRHAGTKNVVMSLWQANDESTSQIMTSFYKYLKDGTSKDEALRKAKLDYLGESANVFPYYWSSFVLLGDSEPLTFSSGNLNIMWLMFGFLVLVLLSFLVYKRKTLFTRPT